MANTLTLTQLDAYQLQLNTGDISGVYTSLLNNGYAYAGWAGGVADGDTVSGVAALDFLTDSAMVGAFGPECTVLSPERIQTIKQQMAQSYLDTLKAIADASSSDSVSRDITAQEVWNFHEVVFDANGLSIGNWTLNIPFALVENKFGAEGLETFWEVLRDTEGKGLDAISANAGVVAMMMALAADSSDPATQAQAEAWLNVIGLDNLLAMMDDAALEVLLEMSEKLNEIDQSVSAFFQLALDQQRFDPLVLDLDGDGIETTAADGSVLFDHDGDGVKHGTGWVKADDGILVLDRNGNGTIDNGTELFGDNTIKAGGIRAQNGFDALKEMDSNNDGLVDANDARFVELRVWRDLNQDGTSQSNELSTLSSLGVRSISVSGVPTQIDVGNGNIAIAQGSFTRVDGTVGTTGSAASLNLAGNTFYREFPDQINVPEELQHLPNMGGSGAVRDLMDIAA
jgi:hypothetical protein